VSPRTYRFVDVKGMIVATMLLLFFQSDVLAFPIPAFRNKPELLDGVSQSHEVWRSLAVQLTLELISDTVCVIFEARRGLNPVAVWRALPKAPLLPVFMIMSAYATLAGSFRVLSAGTFDACENRDMCYCLNNGMRPDGIHEAYCRLLYPNTSGLPSVVGSAP
jgi:hypothetical protein